MNKIYKLTVFVLFFIGMQAAKAQLNPLGALYYNNEYLINPAYAGEEKGLKLNAAYRKLWSGLPGAPLTQNITADYGFKRVGLGINVNNESAGLLKQTRATASYAYHLPIDSGKRQLHFGVSVGVMSQHFDESNVNGNPNDILIGDYNGRRSYIDGDFGIAYTSKRLSIQAAIPNLNNFFSGNLTEVVDFVAFYSALSYNFNLKGGIEVEPKIAFRGVKGYDNLVDFGTRVVFADRKFFLTGIYHSNESTTLGLGVDFMKKYLISGMYTTETSALNSYANGSFELNLRINFSKLK